jgi:environmental stress-induced protein Ves
MTIMRFHDEQLPSTAWKNGGGRTREIVRVPATSSMDDFDWRVSIADISASGPFSRFVGFDRVIVLLSGDGVHLRSTDGAIDHRLDQPIAPFSFAGESAIDATLIGSASTDFNVMTRRAAIRAEVRVVVANETLAECSGGVLFAVRGTWDARSVGADSRSFSLEPNTGLWWESEPRSWDLRRSVSGGVLVAVRLFPSSPR